MYVLKAPDNFSFEKEGIKGKIFDSSNLSNKARFVLIETNTGHKSKIREKESDFFYFILEGEGDFEIEGQVEKVQKGDLVLVPNGKVFKYKGNLKMLLVSSPPWTPKQEETLD